MTTETQSTAQETGTSQESVSPDDLALLKPAADAFAKDGQDDSADDGTDGGDESASEAGDATSEETQEQDGGGDAAASAEGGTKGKTIVTGADAEEEDAKAEEEQEKTAKPYWPENWREKLAGHISAGDAKIYKKELKRLERIADPSGVYGMYRDLEGKFSEGGLIKIPGKDAKADEIAAYRKARGVPDKVGDYFGGIKLENGAVIGEADKPVVDYFAEAAKAAGITPEEFSGLMNAYYARQEDAAAEIDEADDAFRRDSEAALKEEFGPAFRRRTNAIASLFAAAPGGSDIKNEASLYARLMGGRTADGRIIGNDPDMVRFLAGLVSELRPLETVVEDGSGLKGGRARLEEIQALRKTDKKKYYSDAIQAEERDLLAAIAKAQNRAQA